jgi:hypothetical protein
MDNMYKVGDKVYVKIGYSVYIGEIVAVREEKHLFGLIKNKKYLVDYIGYNGYIHYMWEVNDERKIWRREE